MSDTTIYYLSGTGNSLHVARELARRLPASDLVPLLSALKKGDLNRKASRIGLAFPIYVGTIPEPVKLFIERFDLTFASYIFIITTNGGFPGKVDYLAYNKMKAKGIRLDYYSSLKMIVNTATGLMPALFANKKWPNLFSAEKIASMELEVNKELDRIAKDISEMKINVDSNYKLNIARMLLLAITEKYSPLKKTKSIAFIVDEDCNGCGICEKVCLSDKISMVQSRPEWSEQTQCYFCYACFNYCPRQAILVKGYAYKTGRYHHPDIAHKDIGMQK